MKPDKTTSNDPAKRNVTAHVDAAVKVEVLADAAREKRSESYIAGRILTKHYARRLADRGLKLAA